ncbi:MAG: hypothetical protein LBH48_00310 [Bifidobacteriaceae bacterium]|jgi:hypothetical protein|nr:hypothetical protein [Bifidobacteriaceae bacterium]
MEKRNEGTHADDLSQSEREILEKLIRITSAGADPTLPAAVEHHLQLKALEALDKMVQVPPPRRAFFFSWLRCHFLHQRRQTRSSHSLPAPRTRLVFASAAGVTTVVASIVAVIAIVVGTLLPSDQVAPAQAMTPAMPVFSAVDQGAIPLKGEDATPTLLQLAERAASQPDAYDGDVQAIEYAGWWLRTDATGTALDHGDLIPAKVQRYLLPDGNARLVERLGAPLDPKRGLLPVNGKWTTLADETLPGRAEGPLYARLLSTDPDVLTSQLVGAPEDCPDIGFCLSGQVRLLHDGHVVPPRVRAALWMALAKSGGVEFLGRTTDRIGRQAVAFVVTQPDGQRQYIIYADESSGSYLGTETILAQDSEELGLKAPAVIEFIALVDARWIDRSALPPE